VEIDIADSSENGNAPIGSIKAGDSLNDCWLIKDSASWSYLLTSVTSSSKIKALTEIITSG
jgi:hypothetical protein